LVLAVEEAARHGTSAVGKWTGHLGKSTGCLGLRLLVLRGDGGRSTPFAWLALAVAPAASSLRAAFGACDGSSCSCGLQHECSSGEQVRDLRGESCEDARDRAGEGIGEGSRDSATAAGGEIPACCGVGASQTLPSRPRLPSRRLLGSGSSGALEHC